jgi:histone H3/H4
VTNNGKFGIEKIVNMILNKKFIKNVKRRIIMFLNVKAVKTYVKDNNKQISKNAIEALNAKIEQILLKAIKNTGHFTRITGTEINF